MKKIVIMVLFVVLVSILLAGEGKHDNSEFEHFNNYRNEQNAENFNTAINHYFQNDNDYSSNLMLSYLCFMELEKNLSVLESNLDSLTTRTKFSYANLLLDIGKLDESIAIYDILNEEVPKWSCPWRHKGEVLMKQNKLTEAEKATLMAIETREDHFDAYIQLAEIQKNLGKFEEALESLNKGMQFAEADYEDEVSSEDIESLKQELMELLKK